MKFTNFKQSLLMGAVIVGLGVAPQIARATVDNVDVDATVSVVGALDVQKVHDLAFGSWYYVAGSTPSTIVQDTAGADTPTAGTGGTLSKVGSHNAAGDVTVKITGGGASEDGTVVNMTIGTITPFTQDPALVLSDTIAFKAGTAAASTATADGSTTVPVTIETGSAAEDIKLGGTLTLDGAVSGTDTATFNVGFAY